MTCRCLLDRGRCRETAIFPDLVLADPRLIVLTGAQRPADAPDSDGPRTLADTSTVVAHPDAW